MINAMTANVISAIVETPAARPSRPSIKLMAFVIPIIQMIVNGNVQNICEIVENV